MFNSVNTKLNVSMNQAVSGTIQKSHMKSVMMRFHEASGRAKNLFDNCTLDGLYHSEKYVILQMMLSNDGYLLVEIVKEVDFIEDENEINPKNS